MSPASLAFVVLTIIDLCRLSKGDDLQKLEWWQTGVVYQVYSRSFKDSNGDGIGDLKGIEQKADHFKDLGISTVWLNPIFKSPMVDCGYDVSNYTEIYEAFGTMDDFLSLKSKLDSLDIKLLLDFVPNHCSDEHEWFQKSIKRMPPYDNYFIWKDPKGTTKDGKPIPPNNWRSQFGIPAWTYNEERGQFYYHQFARQQPDLNYRCDELVEEIKSVLKFWVEKGVDAFRLDAVPYLFEDEKFQDEPPNEDPGANFSDYTSLKHIYTADLPETYEMVKLLRDSIHEYSKADGKHRLVVTEAYTTLSNTIKYYGDSNETGANMPFNFLFIVQVNAQSQAPNFVNMVHNWMDNVPVGKWPNWVVGNHDNPRITTRYGVELADGINMLNLLLPGTAFTYNGDEIGMTDTFIRWDQTNDPQGINVGPDLYQRFSRDPERSPYQWDNSVSAGFSTNHTTWLPVNPNYWWLNLKNQKQCSRSHYNMYKRLVQLRSNPTVQLGEYRIQALSNWTLVLVRELQSHDTIVVILNLGTEQATIDLDAIENIPSTMTAHTVSVNSELEIGDKLGVFRMRPKSSIVLTSGKVDKPNSAQDSSGSSKFGTLSFKILFITMLYTAFALRF